MLNVLRFYLQRKNTTGHQASRGMRALLLTRLKRPIMPNILWVDDEIDMLKGHLLFLEGKGYTFDTCNNGIDA